MVQVAEMKSQQANLEGKFDKIMELIQQNNNGGNVNASGERGGGNIEIRNEENSQNSGNMS